MHFLFICALLLAIVTVTLQVSSIKEITPNRYNNDIKRVIVYERTIKDIWNTIKNGASNVWESTKCIVNNSKQKITTWISHVENRIREIKTVFEARLNVLKERITKLMNEIVKTSHVVKSCIKEYEESIEETANQIVNHVTSCISRNATKLLQIEIIQSDDFPFHEDLLIKVIEQELNDCLKEKNVEACSYDAKMKIMVEANNKERDILRNHEYIRSILDDLLDAITTCSVDGLIDASANITSEGIKVIRCVVNE